MFFPNSYTLNNINFNPAIVKTHNGIIFDNIVEESSYLFSQNEKITNEDKKVYDESGNIISESTGIVSGYYFWMQNRLQFYERNYKRLQDTLGNIGGITRIILAAAIAIDTIVSDYIILLDTEELSLSLNNFNCTLSERPTIFQKSINHLTNPPRRQVYYFNNTKKSSNSSRCIKEGIIYKNILEREDELKSHITRKNNFNNPYAKLKTDNSKKIAEKKTSELQRKKFDNNRRYEAIRSNAVKFGNEDIKDKGDNLNDKKEKKKYNFCEFIKYFICNKTNNYYILYYEENRNKCLSEESIIKDHLNLIGVINNLKNNWERNANNVIINY
jgi:hypothetical protein